MLVGTRHDDAGEPPERRIAEALAAGDLAGVERLAVAGDESAHHRVLRLVGLHEPAPLPGGAAGAPRHLVQQLEGALGGARVALPEPHIGIDDADEVELGEMVALGDELRADHKVEFAVGDGGELLLHALDAGDEIA